MFQKTPENFFFLHLSQKPVKFNYLVVNLECLIKFSYLVVIIVYSVDYNVDNIGRKIIQTKIKNMPLYLQGLREYVFNKLMGHVGNVLLFET